MLPGIRTIYNVRTRLILFSIAVYGGGHWLAIAFVRLVLRQMLRDIVPCGHICMWGAQCVFYLLTRYELRMSGGGAAVGDPQFFVEAIELLEEKTFFCG